MYLCGSNVKHIPFYSEENELHKPQQEHSYMANITRKLQVAVQTTAPPNTKGKVKEVGPFLLENLALPASGFLNF